MNNPEKLATYCTRDEEQQNKKHNTICGGHRYALTHTNKVNKTSGLIQTTGGKDEPKHRFYTDGNRNGHHNTELRT